MLQPKLSVITVCYNAASTIEATINSVLSLTYEDLEYLIIDGASNDGTVEIVKKYTANKKVKFVSEKDNGVFDAMNKAIGLASGEWVYFIGSDDVFFDQNVVKEIFSKPNFGFTEIVYGNVKFLHSGAAYDGLFDHEKISTKNICHQALFVKKNLFEKIGLFDCKYKMSADYCFNLKWMGQNLPSMYVDDIIAVYNEKGRSGQVWDDVFYYDFDKLLMENNIVCKRSFAFLKKKHEDIAASYSYKLGHYLIRPFAWVKSKISMGFNK